MTTGRFAVPARKVVLDAETGRSVTVAQVDRKRRRTGTDGWALQFTSESGNVTHLAITSEAAAVLAALLSTPDAPPDAFIDLKEWD